MSGIFGLCRLRQKMPKRPVPGFLEVVRRLHVIRPTHRRGFAERGEGI
jgi:hypothetical protein